MILAKPRNFTTCLILQRIVSIRAFSYSAYCHYFNTIISCVNVLLSKAQNTSWEGGGGVTSPAPSSVGAWQYLPPAPARIPPPSTFPLLHFRSPCDVGAWSRGRTLEFFFRAQPVKKNCAAKAFLYCPTLNQPSPKVPKYIKRKNFKS